MALVALFLGLEVRAGAADDPSFERDVRPILVEHCYECHGPFKQEGGLRLSNRTDAFAAGDLGMPVIVAGDASLSHLYDLITSRDPAERMPKDKDALPAAKIETLKRWIDAGAEWPSDADRGHWAYRKPARPALPRVRDASWPRNEIDFFVLERLESEGIVPAAPADRATLLRRVHLDLVGLPPTPEEVDAFVADRSPAAFDAVVDRLLASPRFGEHWARQWLDLARYADSSGFQADHMRTSWAYRDWVIEALNRDMPFDQFTIEQLAGDLLPNASLEQKIATGFHRAAPLNLEAGVHTEESRVQQIFDRVNTTSTVWLGSTLECAQCHDHKYDPFSQREYYALFAYLNNSPEEVKFLGPASYRPGGPALELYNEPEREARLQTAKARLRELTGGAYEIVREAREEKSLGTLSRDARDAPGFAEWKQRMAEAVKKGPVPWQVLEVVSFESTGGEEHRVLPDGSVLVSGPLPDTSTYQVTVKTSLAGITGLRLETLKDDSLPGAGPGRSDAVRPEFVLTELEALVRAPGNPLESATPIFLYGPRASYVARRGAAVHMLDGDEETGWSIADRFSRDHSVSLLTAEPIKPRDGDSEVWLTFVLRQSAGFGRTIGRLRLSASTADPQLLFLSSQARMVLAGGTRSKKGGDRALARQYTRASVDPAVVREIASLRREIEELAPTTTLVMEELDEPRTTHVLQRGSYLDPGEQVTASTPAVLHASREGSLRNRLGLARWLVDESNPLVARVTVNRWWAELFGRGIVPSVEDFGLRGDPPSHPALLDWLAVELVEGGWSRKHVLKTIVMSATYQQSAVPASQETLQNDPRNELLARGPRLRLSAEAVRDNALAIAGILSTKMGGPPVYPPQPEGIWNLTGNFQPRYVPSKGEDRVRRSVYVIWRRSSPYASFSNFDAKDRGACVVSRSRTNTPLQALNLLNDPVYVEAALSLAQRILVERPGASVEERARHGLRLAIGREPEPDEVAMLVRLYQARSARIRESPGDAEAIITKTRGFAPLPELDRTELAAWFFVANAILNLDETITRG